MGHDAQQGGAGQGTAHGQVEGGRSQGVRRAHGQRVGQAHGRRPERRPQVRARGQLHLERPLGEGAVEPPMPFEDESAQARGRAPDVERCAVTDDLPGQLGVGRRPVFPAAQADAAREGEAQRVGGEGAGGGHAPRRVRQPEAPAPGAGREHGLAAPAHARAREVERL